MKRRAQKLALVLISGLFTLPAFGLPPVGEPAPSFSSTTHRGEDLNLSDFKGQLVVLEWTNHDCPFVRKHYETGNMQALQREVREKPAVWISIISSAQDTQGHVSADEAQNLSEARNASPDHIILDESGSIGRLYEAVVTPQMYVIDEQGILIYAGAIDDQPSHKKKTVKTAHNYVRAALDAHLAGEAIAEPVVRPYGCSVKYQR